MKLLKLCVIIFIQLNDVLSWSRLHRLLYLPLVLMWMLMELWWGTPQDMKKKGGADSQVDMHRTFRRSTAWQSHELDYNSSDEPSILNSAYEQNFNFLLFFFLFFFSCRVRNWALKFGVDLWEFGRQFTKMSDIKNVSTEAHHSSWQRKSPRDARLTLRWIGFCLKRIIAREENWAMFSA